MKKLFTLIALACCTVAVAQTEVKFKETTHLFGKIKQNIPAHYTFTYTNTSNKPVVVEFANAECGCTTPEYSNKPLAKGQTDKIKVTYNAANVGAFKKKVNVKFAGVQLPFVLTIEGEVVSGPPPTPKKKS